MLLLHIQNKILQIRVQVLHARCTLFIILFGYHFAPDFRDRVHPAFTYGQTF